MKTDTDYKCFLNRDSDFVNLDIVAQLGTYNCEILFSFDDDFDYIQHQIQTKVPT